MSDTQLANIEADLFDLEEAVESLREELEQTDHPDRQEQIRADIRAAQTEIARLASLLPTDFT